MDYVWQMHTEADVKVSGATATLTRNGKTMSARVSGTPGATFEVVDATAPEPQAQNKGIRKLLVRLPEKMTRATVVVVLSTTEPAEGVNWPALDTWANDAAAR